jgi:sortase A
MQKRYVKVSPVTLTVPVMPFISITLGLTILVWVASPIISFALFYASTGTIITPLAEGAQAYTADASQTIDNTNANTWFPKKPKGKTVSKTDSYFLSIPGIRIEKAKVRIGSDDLSKNLIHYGGTGLPGQPGNAVIFGHSVLPSFYNPTNYMTIFSLLPTLKVGDNAYVNFDGVDYRYEVIGTRVTTPDDVSGLEQTFDDSYLTLVTCVPPGTMWNREWVKLRERPFGDTKYELSRH